MKILRKDGFKLPFMGKDKFAELMRIGVGYDRAEKVFYLRSKANEEAVRRVLAEILKEEVEFEKLPTEKTQPCFLCSAQVACEDCEYYALCPTRLLPFKEAGLYCLCPTCANKTDTYLRYVGKT